MNASKSVTLQDLAALVGGQCRGDTNCEVDGAESQSQAGATHITFAIDEKFIKKLNAATAAAAVVPSGSDVTAIPTIEVGDVMRAFAKIVAHFRPPRVLRDGQISEQAFVHPTAELGPNVSVGPFAYVGADVVIGDDSVILSGARVLDGTRIGSQCTLFPGATIYENCLIGDRCLLHANCVIGAYGFGYDSSSGQHRLSAQLGNVVLEDDVEIGACTTIDRGTFSSTRIGSGSKLDNQVMIGHNCQIGKHNLLCSQVGIAGSCTTGDYVVMAGQVGIGDHLDIGNGATLAAKAGVMTPIPAGETWLGAPATPIRDQMTKMAAYQKLPEMRKQLRKLQQAVEALEKQSTSAARKDAA